MSIYKKSSFTDGVSLTDSNLSEGSKIHLFVKKIDENAKRSPLDLALIGVLRNHLNREDIERVITEFHKELQSVFKNNYSLDDIERLATSLLGGR